MIVDRILNDAEVKARQVGASAARGAAAGVCAVIAAGFLTAAGWMYLYNEFDAVIASLVTGGAFAAFAVIIMSVKLHAKKQVPDTKVGLDDLAYTFLAASQVGRAARR